LDKSLGIPIHFRRRSLSGSLTGARHPVLFYGQ
jgi:hypothetical protein